MISYKRKENEFELVIDDEKKDHCDCCYKKFKWHNVKIIRPYELNMGYWSQLTGPIQRTYVFCEECYLKHKDLPLSMWKCKCQGDYEPQPERREMGKDYGW